MELEGGQKLEMRDIVKEDEYAFKRIYEQLEKMDFNNFICSPLINGGCGLGKTTALVDDRIYELFARKLGKEKPQILVIESRSTTRDQLRQKNTNPNYHFFQFQMAANLDFNNYDIIIIDEAHSLFSDAEFAPRATAPLAEWLRKSLCFQIYITASDIEFIEFANKYFFNKEFELTFPNLDEAHVRYTAKEMYLSISTERISTILKRKTSHFFQERKKGLFFILSAKNVVELYNYYSSLGYKCGFYVSQQNETQIVKREELNEDDPDFFDEYGSRAITIDVLDYYKLLEKQRIQLGRESLREALLNGRFPPDVDYLFMTSTGQEGLSLFDVHLDFIFIEDTFPLTINQKIFRYRGNVDEVFLHLPQRRIEQSLIHTMKQVQELLNASQEYLEGYYKGAGGEKRKGLARAIWYDEEEKKYKVAENYIAFLLTKSETFRALRDNKDNEEWLHANYGQYADRFYLVDAKEDRRKDILTDFFKNKDGVLLTEQLKQEWLEELKELGLADRADRKSYTFDFIIKYCRENDICEFKRAKANKKDCMKDSNLVYRKEYLKIKLL